jgi:hypothetical protein
LIVHDVVFNTNLPNLVFWVSSMVDIQTVSIAIASASVVAGILYYSLQIRNQTKTRQTDLVLRLYTTFGSKEMRQTWENITTRGDMNFDTYRAKFTMKDVNEVGWFFEGVGVLLHKKLIDIAVVDDLFSSPIKISWEKLKPLAEGERKQFGRPQIWEWWEYLYNEMQKREQKLKAS